MTKRKRKIENRTQVDEQIVMETLSSVWLRGAAPRLTTDGACVAGSRFGLEFLKQTGIEAWVTQVDAIALDEQSYREMLNGEPPTGWSVGALSVTEVPNKWNGHVIVETNQWFIDLTAGQFDRPDKGIVFGNGLCVPTGKLIDHVGIWQGDWFEVPVAQGHYLFRDAVVQRDIKKAPDWHGGLTLLKETVDFTYR
jgi:hypothetical protein